MTRLLFATLFLLAMPGFSMPAGDRISVSGGPAAASGGPAVASVDLSTARRLYFSMTDDGCMAKQLADLFDKAAPTSDNPLLKAYYGAAAAAAPGCITNPATKIASFNKGKRLLEEAVKLDPRNPEIRFLRFATQVKAPGFLGYNKNISHDKQVILRDLSQLRKTINNTAIFTEITNFLLLSNTLTADEKKQLKD